MSEKLKPCPFCGGNIRKIKGFGGISYYRCKNADCNVFLSFGGNKLLKSGCLEAERPDDNWNRRIPDIVRCKECDMWNDWDSHGHMELNNFRCSCAHWSNEDGHTCYTAPDDFCSYGQRRESEEANG